MTQLLVLLLPAMLWASPSHTEIFVQKLGEGRNLHVQLQKPDADAKPTFLFLPGVNRAPLLDEPASQALIQKGYGAVAFNFSVQPVSIATLPERQRPYFYTNDIDLEALAFETEMVVKELKTKYGIQNLIPVSLSYSGAVSFYLKGFHQIVDAAPLTSMDAFSTELAQTRRALLATELMLGPIMGPANTRYWLDQAYRSQWVPQVKSISEQFNLPKDRSDEMVDGYIRLSRAAEGFEWKVNSDRTPRIFILAAKDAPTLLKNQIQLVIQRLEAGFDDSVVLVMESGHVVPADQPEVYAQILIAVSDETLKPGLTVITPSTQEWKNLGQSDSLRFLRGLR